MPSTSSISAPISSRRWVVKGCVRSPCATVVTACVSSRSGWLTPRRSTTKSPAPSTSSATPIEAHTAQSALRWSARASSSDTSATTHQSAAVFRRTAQGSEPCAGSSALALRTELLSDNA